MSSNRLRLRRSSFSLSLIKHDIYESPPRSPPGPAPGLGLVTTTATSSSSILTPDVLQSVPTQTLNDSVAVTRIGDYLLHREIASTTSQLTTLPSYDAVHIETGEEFRCKVLPLNSYRDLLAVYFRVGSHPHIITLKQVIIGATCAYAFFPRHYGDLHSYVRAARRLNEAEAARLFSQIVSVVEHCHMEGIIVRDLKLRKFVFKDVNKTELMLESLDDASLLSTDSDDDLLCDRHGCPAYVSPEILTATEPTYSGRAADIWSLGVILFTMLVGRYPFHDADPVALFRTIRHVRYVLPRHLISESATCLIRWILRSEPKERPAACEISNHPWMKISHKSLRIGGSVVGGPTGIGGGTMVISRHAVVDINPMYYTNDVQFNSIIGTNLVTASKDVDFERFCLQNSLIDQTVPEFERSFTSSQQFE